MINNIIFQVKYELSHFSFNSKKAINERLKLLFGKLKEETFNFSLIKIYFSNKDNSNAFQVLNDKTCNDLDFDDLFTFLDRTNSKIGQQYFYNKLRVIDFDENQINLDEEIISELSKDAETRASIQQKIEKLNHKDAFYIATLFQEEHVKPPKWFFLIKLLSFTCLVSVILSFFNPIFFVILIVVFCINFIVHYWNKRNLFKYVDSIPQLIKLNKIASILHTNPLLKKLNPDLLVSIKLINKIKKSMLFFQLEAKLQGEFQIIAWFLFEIFKTLFLLEPILLFGVLKKLNTKRNEIENVYKFVGHIDMLISIASLRNGLDTFCLPSINKSDKKIVADEVSHPLIYNCKTNSIQILDKSILLTGSNMSGKTSFIRAIGLNIITGLTINTCFAKSISFPLTRIFSAIRISDDLMQNKSYYFEEVLTIKEMISESNCKTNNIFLLDEIFKGTNTVERISAGKAVLSSLAKENNIVLVSTHDIELADMLLEEYDLYHFSEIVENDKIDFDYKLKEGKLKNRNAIRILEINDYPKELIREAIDISKKLDKTYLAT